MARRLRTWGSLDTWGSVDRGYGRLFGSFAAIQPEYHLVLGTRGLILAKGGYSRTLQQRQAAQLATGGLNTSSRIKDQAVTITGWQGGEGTKRHSTTNPSRFWAGSGIDIYSESGSVGMGPHIVTAQSTALDGFTCMESHEGKIYVGTSSGLVYSWDGATWTLVRTSGKAGGVRSLKSYAGAIFMGNGTDGVVEASDTGGSGTWGTNFTVAGLSGGTVNGVYALQTHYLLDSNNIAHEKLIFGASSSNYGLIGVSDSAATAANQFAIHETRVQILLQLKQNLLAVGLNTADRKSALFRASENYDDTTVNAEWRHVATLEDSLLMCGAVLDNTAYFGDAYYGRIWAWDGTDFRLHRQLATPDNAYAPQILGMVAFQGGLWLSILDTDGTVALLRDNGSSDWSRPVTGLSGTTPGPLGIYAGNLYVASNTTGASKLFNTNGTFRSTAQVDSGLIDASLPGELKLWSEVTVQHTALLSGESVAVYYSLEDHGSWTLLGTSDTDGAQSATFSFPNGTLAKLLALRLVMTAASGASSQLKVYEMTGSYNPSKGAKREWRLTVKLFGHDATEGDDELRMALVGGTEEPLTGEELSAELWGLLEAEEPVLFYDRDRGEPTMVIVEEYSESDGQDEGGGMPNINGMAAGWDLSGQLSLKEI